MMHRNLDRRVEVLVRLPTVDSVAEVSTLLDKSFAPETDSWVLGPDGEWKRHPGPVHLQETLIAAQRTRRHS